MSFETPISKSAFLAPLGLLATLAVPLSVLLAIAAVLIGFRRWMSGRTTSTEPVNTWGCGYAYPAPSMQYTGSSYGWKLLDSFRQIARPKRLKPAINGCFPAKHACGTETPDFALDRVFRPAFIGLARAFGRMWPMQHGRVQLYLVYIVATVLFVFLVEAWQTPFTTGGPSESAHSASSGFSALTLPVSGARTSTAP